MALSATANAELKVATVDVQKLFADYYKTHEAQAKVEHGAKHTATFTISTSPIMWRCSLKSVFTDLPG